MSAALNYNENKVNQGKAVCLSASGYMKETGEMNFYQKLQGLEHWHELNERAQTKTLHVSLNFSPTEKFADEKLIAIANDYMNRIGFGEQPFLVYKHLDAGHPHMHIVSSTIRSDGSRINTHNIGRNQSEKARKVIESRYALVPAEKQPQSHKQKIQPVNAEKIVYGKSETKKAITNVVNAILNAYHYTSIPEFNAILKQYNVVADRGSEDGRIFKHRGLVYRVLDAQGNKIGVPIKASSINSQPTLNKLEELFAQNKEKNDNNKQKLKASIDEIMKQSPATWKEMIQRLSTQQIYTVLRQNAEGRVYGVTFVDNKHKTVFNGSDLGKTYSAPHLQHQFLSTGKTTNQARVSTAISGESADYSVGNSSLNKNAIQETKPLHATTVTPLLEELLAAEKQQAGIPFQLKKKKRRKKRRLGL